VVLWDLDMAEVIVGLKVLPKTIEVDLDKLEEEIKKAISPDRIQREPIAFGLVAFHVVKIVPDAGGEIEKIESKLKEIEDVGEIEVTGISRGY
jgi:translation elongation factor aEF-1 beta